MPEIGATLREARMRQHLDISDIEAQTKIRAKYLRALENEEWDLLPGPTFVKTFLRTYAEALGLDARLVLEEYKLRYERLSDAELHPIAPQTQRDRERAKQRARGSSVGRDVTVAAVVVAIVGVLILLGRGGGDDNGTDTVGTTPGTSASATPPTDTSTTKATTTAKKAPAKPTTVRLRLVPTGQVYVCLKAGSKVLIAEQTLTPETPARTYKAKSFKLLVGNNALSLRVNGKKQTVPSTSVPLAYEFTTKGRHKIAADTTAICT